MFYPYNNTDFATALQIVGYKEEEIDCDIHSSYHRRRHVFFILDDTKIVGPEFDRCLGHFWRSAHAIIV